MKEPSEPKGTQDYATLKADLEKGLSDLAAGRVKDFDVAVVIKRGRELDQTIAEVRSRFADISAEELAALIEEAISAARSG